MTTTTISTYQSGLTVNSGNQLDVISGGKVVSSLVSGGGVDYISSGGIAITTFLGGFGAEIVYGGGVASGTIVEYAAEQVVSVGGTTVGTVISSGGVEIVQPGGTLDGAVVQSGGVLVLLPGAQASGTITVNSGGVAISSGVLALSGGGAFSAAGATLSGAVIGSGGQEFVLAGGTAISPILSSGGQDDIYAGGTTVSATLLGSATQYVYAGGTASGTVLSGGYVSGVLFGSGFVYVESSGTTVGAQIGAYDAESVYYDGLASGSILLNGGHLYVDNGGTTSATLLEYEGDEFVEGGVTRATIVSSGGYQNVYGGSASATVLSSGGRQQVQTSGTASGTIVDSGGVEIVSAGGVTTATIVSSGGTEIVSSGGVADGTILDSGGVLLLLAGARASGTVSSGGVPLMAGVVVLSGGAVVSSGSTTLSGATVGAGEQEDVLSGGTASSSLLSGGGQDDIYGGGTTVSAALIGNASQYVYPGGLASGTVMTGYLNGVFVGNGDVYVEGGTTIGAQVGADDHEFVYNNAVASASILLDGGQLYDYGGTTSATLVENGGYEYVEQAGTSYSTNVSGGGIQTIFYATANATVLSSGGRQQVQTSGVASGTVIDSGGFEAVSAGGVTTATVVGSGGTEVVSSGGTADGTILDSGGYLTVSGNGASATATMVSSGGAAFVFSGGTAGGTTVSSGGVLLVAPGGLVSAPTLQPGAIVVSSGVAIFSGAALLSSAGSTMVDPTIPGGESAFVFSGGTVSGAEMGGVSAPGSANLNVFSGGAAIFTTLLAGAEQFVSSGATASGTVVSSGGSEWISPSATDSGSLIDSGGAAYITPGAVVSGAVLQAGAELQIENLAYTSSGSVSFNSGNNLLTVTEGTSAYTQYLSGDYTSDYFTASPGFYTGATEILVNAQPATVGGTPCFCRGTLILTISGEKPVQDLRIGDRVVTCSATARPIRWVGRRAYAVRFAAANPEILPIRIAAGALADGIPRRDLLVSPLHAMYLDGMLIPASALVNGRTIVQLEAAETIEYFHIELESHDVILAEGAPSETFVDDDSRAMFHNAAEYRILYPDSPPTPPIYCAPRVEHGEALEAVRRRLARRADPAASPARLDGRLDEVSRERISGWARDPDAPDQPVRLRICDGGVVLGEVVADRHRPDLEAAGFGSGHCSFEFVVPGGLSPLVPHVITVERAADRVELPHSPITLAAAPPAPLLAHPPGLPSTLRGSVDIVTRERISGWAQNPRDPTTPTALQILDNATVIARVLANRHRPDLQQAGIGSGRHGFDITIPGGLSPLARHVVRVTNEHDGADLAPPVVIEAIDSFDATLEQTITRAIAALGTTGDHQRVLSFIMAQADRLRKLHADGQAGRTSRIAYREASRAQRLPAAPAPRQRALVIDERVPHSGRDGGSQAILSHIQALQRLGYQVAVAAALPQPGEAAARLLLAAEDVTIYAPPLYATVEDLLQGQADGFDIIYLHRAEIAARYLALARAHFPRSRIIYSIADLHHVRLARQAAIEQLPGLHAASRRLRLMECTAAWSADAVITHSPAEAEQLRRMVPEANVHLVPWDLPLLPSAVPFAARHGIAFIGHYGHAPNRDAADWLVHEVMPRVWQVDPAITCRLVGSDMPPATCRLARPGVSVMGHVADLGAAVFDQVRLTVAPLRFGAGINAKVLESLAAGIPCVMSELAAEGLLLPAPLHALVGRDAAALAALICRVHADEAANGDAATAGLSLIRRDFSPDRVTATLAAALERPAASVVWSSRSAI
jgi:autotransporter passenger strand-loop-strand repeat protein